jgi:ABC-2 type transport system ATP-binding protein
MEALTVRALTRRYGDVVAVQGVDLTVTRGAVYGLLGPNGSGKTTTLACALGLLRPTSGEVRVLGVPAERLHRTRGRVGVVFDTPALIKGLSVAANLAYAARLRGHGGGRSAGEALELVGLTDLARRHAGKLSLGQQKRLSIAIALAGTPELLVLDEPLSGLDPLGVRQVLRLVRRLADAAVLLRGKVAAAGALDELLGGTDRHRIGADDPRRARDVVAGFEGARVVADGPELLVELGGHPVSALNRALVEAGVAVSSIATERSSLPALFESLVDAVEEQSA